MSIMKILPLTAILLSLGAAPAAAAVPSTPVAVHVNQAGFAARGFRGGGFRSRPRVGTRPRYRYSPRPHFGRRLFHGFLQALGFAYLFHLLFGWGGGGSPFGLFLLAAIVLWLVTRRRRRAMYY
jgi:uncharacterized membrane protein